MMGTRVAPFGPCFDAVKQIAFSHDADDLVGIVDDWNGADALSSIILATSRSVALLVTGITGDTITSRASMSSTPVWINGPAFRRERQKAKLIRIKRGLPGRD